MRCASTSLMNQKEASSPKFQRAGQDSTNFQYASDGFGERVCRVAAVGRRFPISAGVTVMRVPPGGVTHSETIPLMQIMVALGKPVP